MKIDVYSHLIPKKYWDEVIRRLGNELLEKYISREALGIELTRTLWNLDERFQVMDRYNDVVQVLVPSGPALELLFEPEEAAELAKLYNDELANLLVRYPDRFAGAVAFLPMNNIDAALKETDRAINDLGFSGILIQTPIYGNSPEITKPMDMDEFIPLYEMMAHHDRPIWIHPKREFSTADYSIENRSKYLIHQMFGWPYETAVAMSRLVYSGVMENYPDLKFITHHSGGIVPFLADRIVNQCKWYPVGLKARFLEKLSRPAVDYFKLFYCDTAIYANTSAFMCAYSFFGADRVMFGTDFPYDDELGHTSIRETMNGVNKMQISEGDKRKIFEGNAKAILKIDVKGKSGIEK